MSQKNSTSSATPKEYNVRIDKSLSSVVMYTQLREKSFGTFEFFLRTIHA